MDGKFSAGKLRASAYVPSVAPLVVWVAVVPVVSVIAGECVSLLVSNEKINALDCACIGGQKHGIVIQATAIIARRSNAL